MKIFTIGFTRKSAATFFSLLRQPGLVSLTDIRLNNTSQLAGFTKKDDLKYFVESLCGISYSHLPDLTPSAEILHAYKNNGGDWQVYEQQFLSLMAQRQVDTRIAPAALDGTCLLCSEASPAQCHRRLVAEYLQSRWIGLEIHHLT
jgi:uncharacterized protein (DUF488 family)